MVNGIARLVLEQVYINPTDQSLQLEYSTPVNPKVCVNKFKAVFEKIEI